MWRLVEHIDYCPLCSIPSPWYCILLSQETGQATSEVEGMVVSMMKTKLTVALVTAQYINFMGRQGSTYQVSGMGQLAIGLKAQS